MQRQIEIFNEAADDYDSVGVDFFSPFGAALAEAAAIAPGERVLDVGCGRGTVLFPAAAATGPPGRVHRHRPCAAHGGADPRGRRRALFHFQGSGTG
ncbi:hypothetical protein KZ829_36295 [Actinoplanes hulinensis]|uniref:Methyltransferase domain-containing protein n=1 Tax=Actinoplanes hulinensis TaxID=1144547 RepID=A0ABS7BEB0_9ACTN|nr:hypothetical protein [Actinoplanes hulinensis]